MAADGAEVLVRLKVVPGASRSALAGVLGDRVKVRVAAPPEGGKANAAVCALLAEALGVPARSVTIESGHGSAEKVVRVRGVSVDAARRALLGEG